MVIKLNIIGWNSEVLLHALKCSHSCKENGSKCDGFPQSHVPEPFSFWGGEGGVLGCCHGRKKSTEIWTLPSCAVCMQEDLQGKKLLKAQK